jgi:hypothetical protein
MFSQRRTGEQIDAQNSVSREKGGGVLDSRSRSRSRSICTSVSRSLRPYYLCGTERAVVLENKSDSPRKMGLQLKHRLTVVLFDWLCPPSQF